LDLIILLLPLVFFILHCSSIFISTIMAILFRIDFHEDWAVGGEKKKFLVPGKDNPEPIL